MDKSHVVGLGRAVARSDAEGGAAGEGGNSLPRFCSITNRFEHKPSKTTKYRNQYQVRLGRERWDKKIR